MLKKIGLDEQLRLIGCGEMITGILLIVPWTSSLGVLLASGFWGGTILAHMSMHDTYIPQSVILALTWLGALLAAAGDVQQLLAAGPQPRRPHELRVPPDQRPH